MTHNTQAAARHEAAEAWVNERYPSEAWSTYQRVKVQQAHQAGWDARGQHDAAQQQSQEPVADAEVEAMIALLEQRANNVPGHTSGITPWPDCDGCTMENAATLLRRLSTQQQQAERSEVADGLDEWADEFHECGKLGSEEQLRKAAAALRSTPKPQREVTWEMARASTVLFHRLTETKDKTTAMKEVLEAALASDAGEREA